MTRINVVPPSELCDQHLLAEWRELTRIPNGIASGKYRFNQSSLPKKYTVRTNSNPSGGRGHMKFFFDKLEFLYLRYGVILEELSSRGIKVQSMWTSEPLPISLWNDYVPTEEALALSRKRIAERMPKRARYRKELGLEEPQDENET